MNFPGFAYKDYLDSVKTTKSKNLGGSFVDEIYFGDIYLGDILLVLLRVYPAIWSIGANTNQTSYLY